MKLCMLYLTCADEKEADKITKSLLEKKLVFCVKKFPVSSSFLWHGKIDNSSEVLLIMDSFETNFKQVEHEVAKLHSYETFVLLSSPVTQKTKDVENWVRNLLQ